MVILTRPASDDMEKGFVYVRDIEPSIIENIRYYTTDNFVGERIDGYLKPVAIATKECALALQKVQREVIANNWTIVLYDVYRPKKAVAHFIRWGESDDVRQKAQYYPRLNKSQVFNGYLARKSGHSRGSTVDLSLIPVGQKLSPVRESTRIMADGAAAPFRDDGTMDCGTSWDLLDTLSNHDNPVIAATNPVWAEKRNYLRNVMMRHGFRPLPTEWWHYTLNNEPFNDTYFDFDVK